MTRALIVVDVQNDFCEGGSLAVAGGAQVAQSISEYLREYHDNYALIVASRDFHPPHLDDHNPQPGEDPDYVNTWPVHCVQSTEGSEYHPSLAISYVNVHVTKGEDSAAYSAFEGQDFDYRSLEEIFHRTGITDVDVVGIATDYCVKATALDAARLGYSTSVIMDLTAAVGGDEAKDRVAFELGHEGVETV